MIGRDAVDRERYLRENVASEAPMFGPDFVAFLERQERLYRELLGRPA